MGLVVYATFSYVGMMLAIRSNRDEFSLIIPYVRFRQATVQDAPLVIDSNVIIDGRLPALCATGFLSSSLVVPRFVLEELQRLADSSDGQKRERGRLAFERLQRMQIDPNLSVTIHETEEDEHTAVDTRLIQIAKLIDARLLTNDSALCAIARLQNVSVLNLNDLTLALRPHLAAGDHVDLTLVKEGRDTHQAVGYLSDGTMIVVNHARAHIGRTMPVVVASALQTSAGRLFFADLRASPRDGPATQCTTRAASSGKKRLKFIPRDEIARSKTRSPTRKGRNRKPRRLKLGFELDQALKRFEKILKCRSREHDGVTPSAHIFGDLQEPTALIFFEVEEKDLPLDSDFFRSDRIGSQSLPTWILVAHIQTITNNSAQAEPTVERRREEA